MFHDRTLDKQVFLSSVFLFYCFLLLPAFPYICVCLLFLGIGNFCSLSTPRIYTQNFPPLSYLLCFLFKRNMILPRRMVSMPPCRFTPNLSPENRDFWDWSFSGLPGTHMISTTVAQDCSLRDRRQGCLRVRSTKSMPGGRAPGCAVDLPAGAKDILFSLHQTISGPHPASYHTYSHHALLTELLFLIWALPGSSKEQNSALIKHSVFQHAFSSQAFPPRSPPHQTSLVVFHICG